jgi:hypothetical protein
MTRPQTWGKPLSLTEAMADAAAFADRFGMLEDGPAVWNQLSELSRHYASPAVRFTMPTSLPR